MPTKRTKYFVLPSPGGANYTDFDLALGAVSLSGQEVTFVGSSGVDSIFVRPGLTVDFVLSGSGSDAVYLPGRFSDYVASVSGTNMTVQRGADATLEKVTFTKAVNETASDRIIFADGTVNSLALFNSLKTTNPTPLGAIGGESSLSPVSPGTLNASIKAFALGDGGDTFAPAKAGVQMILVGSVSADTVYVADGANVDATLLGSGKDLVYFRGNWADYSKVVSGSYITFSRTVNGSTETVKVTGGSAGLNDQLIFADGATGSLAARSALVAAGAANTSSVALSSLTDFDSALRTPGLGLGPTASALDNVTNFDVSSNIVLTFPEAVTAVAGKVIRIVNTGGAGFRGENTINSLDIPVDSAVQVQISGATVTINPAVDLDFGNEYYIAIEAGAFSTASGKSSEAFEGVSSLNFSTVTPGATSSNLPSVSNASPSVAMGSDGKLTASYSYLDIEGIGNPAAGVPTALDVSSANVALVFKDYDPSGPDANLGYDGVRAGNINLAVTGFGAGDLLYVDNQSTKANNLALTAYSFPGAAPTTVQFAGNDLGGFIYLTVAGSSAGFSNVGELKALLGNVSYDPIVSDGLAAIAADTTAPVIGTAATIAVAENNTRVVNLTADEPVTWSIVSATGSTSADARFFKIDGSSTLAFASAPNFEQAGRSPAYSVRVAATDTAGNRSTKDLTVNVTDVNETPIASGSIGAQTAAIGKAFTLSLSGRLTDPDSATTSAGTLSYSFSPTLPSWLTFNEANLTLSGTPTAASAATSYTFKATDGGAPGLSATQTFSLSVLADLVVTGFTVSDASGATTTGKSGDSLTFSLTTSEAVTVNTGGGTPTATFTVGGASVVAQYTGGSGTSTLTFVGQAPAGANGIFQLSALATGGATIAASAASSRSLTTSVVGQTFSGYTLDNTAPSVTAATPIKVNENATAVGTLTTSEPVTFSALGATGDSSFFTLNNGVLSFKAGQNFEQTGRSNTYSVPVTLTDAAGNATTRTITVELQDVNEFQVSALTDRNAASNSVMENSAVGTPVGYTAFASDADGSNNGVSYKLLSSDGASDYTGKEFKIDATTGVVSVAGPIDYEALGTSKALAFHVKATSTDGSSSTTTSPVSIAILDDVNETVPIVLQSASVISPSTTSIAGTTAAGAVVKVFLGTATTASATVTADGTGGWSVPVSNLSGLVSGTNAIKFTATVGSTVGTLNQSFLYSGAPSWTQGALKVASIRGTVDQALSSDGKITHAEAVSILDSAIAAAKAANGASGTVGDSILADLRAVSLRGDSVFTSPDLTGKESGYLSYVFDKVVNTSAANAFFTGGTTTRQALGNLNGNSPISDLEKLRDKWLLGLDLPDPRTEGDTANPTATGASGEYRAFNGSLVIDGFGYTDVRQGSMGDCYLLAGAAGIAEASTYAKTPAGAADPKLAVYATAFETMFSANSGAPSWGVRFYDVFNKPHWVTVNNQLVVPVGSDENASPSYAKIPVSPSTGKGELWVPLLEKAYAQANETGIFERDNSSNAFFAIEGGWGTNLQQMLGGGTAFLSTQKTVSWTRGYFGLTAAEVNAQLGNSQISANTPEGIMNLGHPFYFGSMYSTQVGGKIGWTEKHAFAGFDPLRADPANTNIQIYNPWGPTSSIHVSPFSDNLSTMKANAKLSIAFRVPEVPSWVTKYFDGASAQKAAAAKPVSSASVLQSAPAFADLGQSFLKIAAGVSTAYADNGTADTADDRQGLFKLSGSETGVKVVLTPKAGVTADQLSSHSQAISGATLESFFDAVNAAKAVANVNFVYKPNGAVDITGDPKAETGVSVALGVPAEATGGQIVFLPVKEIGEVGTAKVDTGLSATVENTKLFPEAHSINIDASTGAVMFIDSEGYWQVGKFGELKSTYVSLTFGAGGTKINADTFEASAKAAQFIFDSNGTTVTGFEVIVASNENPDDLFTLYFDSTGALAGSEYLSPAEELEAEGEYQFDVNESGALGNDPAFLAEGIAGAPDLYADPYGDLALLTGTNNGSPVYLTVTILDNGEAVPVNLYDFEDGIEFTAVVKAPDSTVAEPKYLLYLQFGDDEIATVTVQKTGAILLDSNGDILVGAPLTPQQEAELEQASGIDLGRDGDAAAQSPLITGNADDNTFDSRGDGTNDRYKDSTGDDTYFGGEGDDLLIGILSGEPNYASRGANVFYGGDGNDRFAGMGDGDIFLAGAGQSDSVWVNGARTAFEILLATPEQMALARAVDESVETGYVIREVASGSMIAVFDAEVVEFAVGGFTGQLSNLATPYTYTP